MRTQSLFWRGGGGAPPCLTRSPSLAMREGDWKLLFTPRTLAAPAHAPVRTNRCFFFQFS